jgi:hypothetical protein
MLSTCVDEMVISWICTVFRSYIPMSLQWITWFCVDPSTGSSFDVSDVVYYPRSEEQRTGLLREMQNLS